MAATRAPYPPEFRRKAVRLVRESGRPKKQIARELGITSETLRLWVRQAAIGEGEQEDLTREERVRLHELERENRLLREEREILKKVAAFFARESDPRR